MLINIIMLYRQNKLTVDTYKIDSKISYIEQLKRYSILYYLFRDIQRVQKKKVSQHDIAKIEMIKDDVLIYIYIYIHSILFNNL